MPFTTSARNALRRLAPRLRIGPASDAPGKVCSRTCGRRADFPSSGLKSVLSVDDRWLASRRPRPSTPSHTISCSVPATSLLPMASATLSLSLARIGTGPTESRMSLRATSSTSPRTCVSASAPADSLVLNRRYSARNSCTAKSPSGCDQPLNTEWHPSVDGHSTCSRIVRVIIKKERLTSNKHECCKKSWLQNTANKCDTSLASGCSAVRGGGGDIHPPDR